MSTTKKALKSKTPLKTGAKSAKAAKKKIAAPALMKSFKKKVEQVALQVEGLFTSNPQDIVAAIKEDHESLRNYLGILKDTSKDMSERREAYAAFSALLKSHTLAEEKAVYEEARELIGRDMQIKITEGFVEHQLADDLMKRIDGTREAMEWSAHANVLSEIVEHHLDEEERDLLPMIRKAAPAEKNMDMLTEFISLRGKTQKRVSDKNAGVLKAIQA